MLLPSTRFLLEDLVVLESCKKADEKERKDPAAIQRTVDQIMSLLESWPCFILYYLLIDNSSSSYSLVTWVVGFRSVEIFNFVSINRIWLSNCCYSVVPRTRNLVSSERVKTLDPPCDR